MFYFQGADEVAKFYKITSLSWRNMVCPLLKRETFTRNEIFTRKKLFAEDEFHPSILAHAQMAYIIIDYIRTGIPDRFCPLAISSKFYS